MAGKRGKPNAGAGKSVETLRHGDATRKNIPTAEHRSVLEESHKEVKTLRYPRNPDLDPQLVWRGKDEQDAEDLVVHAPPLYIQEKIHPKALIDDLLKETRENRPKENQLGLFADFNGMPAEADRTAFYQYDQNWSNRMILGDSLQVMASLAEREGLRGQVQCIYMDPPYGIKFNSNFQWSTTTRNVKDGSVGHITREPEQVKAFRDTWRHGIHSYLAYLRDRLQVARDMLAASGAIFVQIGDENVHRVRVLMDEVFGDTNCIALISVKKTSGATSEHLPGTTDFILFYARDKTHLKYRQCYLDRQIGEMGDATYAFLQEDVGVRTRLTPDELNRTAASKRALWVFRLQTLASQSLGRTKGEGAASWFSVALEGHSFRPSASSRWKTNEVGMRRLQAADRVARTGNSIAYVRFHGDFPVFPVTDLWIDTQSGSGMEKTYVVQTSQKIVERCLLMTSDPGDLVLDPTCGSGTTAYVAEQWGRRWITIDTSRVALALARARIMGARYPYYLLADSPEGQAKEAQASGREPSTQPTHGKLSHGFVYERVPHVTLKSIANNSEIDVIWEEAEKEIAPIRDEITRAIGKAWLDRFRKTQKYDVEVPPSIQEWEIPREIPSDWPEAARSSHERFWNLRIARQAKIDASIAAKADVEHLYDRPYEDRKVVRVAGPFTVESISPHRVLEVDENEEIADPMAAASEAQGEDARPTFREMILENLRVAGVQQANKEDRITFTALTGWPGRYISAEGTYQQGEETRKAAVFIGPEFGTVTRPDLVDAAREAGEAGFDVLVACAFNFEAHASGFDKLGRIPVLKARMNADLHMAGDLKATATGNIFVVFGEPDVEILSNADARIRVKVNGVDVFDPTTGEVRSDDPDRIACWFIDTNYDGESFFVRHAYFLGANDPYKALKTTLKAEIDPEAWATLHGAQSRPFPKPKTGRIAVKVINHLGDEVMKVFRSSA